MDRHCNDLPPPGIDLGTLMRRLPDTAPPDDAWQRLSARAQRRRGRRRGWRVGASLALAASLAALALTAMLPSTRPTAPHAPPQQVASTRHPDTGTATAPTTGQLRERSTRLESWVRRLRADSPPLAGAALAQRTALENQIALIDQQLDSRSGSDDHALWQQRVDRLQRIALLQLTSDAVASNSGHAAPPAVWVN